MRRKIPGAELLIAFETAARHQSFTRAAEELSLTQSAVGELLVSVRHSESELLEKEEQKRKARPQTVT